MATHAADTAIPEHAAPAGKAHGGPWKLLILLGTLAALLVLGGVFREQVKQGFLDVLDWLRSLGPLGPVLFGAIYVVACVLLLPGSVLTLGAGFVFGVAWGTVTVSIASTLGATAAFLVGRNFARDWIARKVAGRPRFAAIDDAVGREGFKIVLLTRLSPIFPFNMLNYAYGLTKVRTGPYMLASWIGMLPGTIMFVYLGSLFGELAELAAGRQKSPAEYVFFIVGLVIAVGVAVFVTHVARRALRQSVAQPGVNDDDGPADG